MKIKPLKWKSVEFFTGKDFQNGLEASFSFGYIQIKPYQIVSNAAESLFKGSSKLYEKVQYEIVFNSCAIIKQDFQTIEESQKYAEAWYIMKVKELFYEN